MPSPRQDAQPAILHVTALNPARPVDFDLRPDAETRAAIADDLGIDALRKVRLAGRLSAEGQRSWRLTATLGATVTQPCVVTLDPVTTRIDTDVTRLFLPEDRLEPPRAGETEMPEDDSVEPLGDAVDLLAILAEALALSLPPFPRSDGAVLENAEAAPAGSTPIETDRPKPFAALAGLREKLEKGDE
jgi:uncharacterized metal-binding protein YceD (DUF177 family)